MRIALLAHSTLPRGGVAHALAVAEAFNRLGHEAVVHAPAGEGQAFHREAGCETRLVAATPVTGGLGPLVKTRIADYVRHFAAPGARRFDVFHAGDGISANALATLRQGGLIPAFSYTVHHVDRFGDAEVDELQRTALRAADRHMTVSRLWQERLAQEHGLAATLVGNGVDRTIYGPRPDGRDEALRLRLGLDAGPLFLSVGGVEKRKNTLAILRAFGEILTLHPGARLVIAGGASLLDHSAYRAAFDAALEDLGARRSRVVLTGAIDQADMPALYRIADALVFPSLMEGFGLAALEAIACGTPAIVSGVPPFTEHFGDRDVLWCDPHRPASIADAMALALQPGTRIRLAGRTETTLAPHDWDRVARAHLPVFERLREPSMPEMIFRIRWPDGRTEDCYSPSLVIKDHLQPGRDYPLADFRNRARTALSIASERVRAKYGFPCSRALAQLERIEAGSRPFEDRADASVGILSFQE